MASIEVLVVDDSAVVRQVLSEILNKASDIEVIAVASDPIFAQAKLETHWPDVIILDIEMPRMDGITFLRQIMQHRPTPVVICSSLATEGAELTLNAMSAGAVEVITKPQLGVKDFLKEGERAIQQSVRAAAAARVRSSGETSVKAVPERPMHPGDAAGVTDLAAMARTTDTIVAIGCSTGGVQALEEVVTKLPRTCPGVVVVQHMPEKFTVAFAKRLNSISSVEVKEAETGDRIIPGRILIAKGGQHLEVQRSGAQYITRVFPGPAVNRHCPSVDVLFRSVASAVKKNAVGVIMTGMGDDGAQGLLEMKRAGAVTFAQNEASSVVFGMPNEAIKRGAADHVVDLSEIAQLIDMHIIATAYKSSNQAAEDCVGTPSTLYAEPLQIFYTDVFNGYNNTNILNPAQFPMTVLSNSTYVTPKVKQGATNLNMTLTVDGVTGNEFPTVTFDGEDITAQVLNKGSVTYAVPGNSYPGTYQTLEISLSADANAQTGLRKVYVTNAGQEKSEPMEALFYIIQ